MSHFSMKLLLFPVVNCCYLLWLTLIVTLHVTLVQSILITSETVTVSQHQNNNPLQANSLYPVTKSLTDQSNVTEQNTNSNSNNLDKFVQLTTADGNNIANSTALTTLPSNESIDSNSKLIKSTVLPVNSLTIAKSSSAMASISNNVSTPQFKLISSSNGNLTSSKVLNASLATLIDPPVTESIAEIGDVSISPKFIPFVERFELIPLLISIGLIVFIILYFTLVKNRVEHCYMFITILVAGFGNLGAGFVLSSVQHWPVFYYVSELLVLEPTLLGLKGNIEMCMASRLATQANLGNMKSWREIFKMVWGNLGLDLTQATTVAFVAASSVLAFSAFAPGIERWTLLYNGSILVSSSMLTAVTTSFLLGSLLVTVIVFSYRMNMNPDNIGSPVAASLGDVITLTFLAFYSSFIFNHTETPPATPVPGLIIITVLLVLLPLWFTCAYTNSYTKPSMWSGWTPIFIAVLISTCSGLILDAAVFRFTRYSVFQPVMNGIGGNLVAVHASRMSTALHKSSSLGELPSDTKLFRSPLSAFWDKANANIEMARNLVAMAVPAHIIYIFITVSLKTNIVLTSYFLIFYIASAVFQIIILLYFATHLVNLMWKFSIDPDNTSIPILTATGDFLGSLFLYFTFLALEQLTDINAF